MLTNMNFYDICHEHLSYYSLAALQRLMERNGLTIFDASTNAVNGGSLRAFVTHAGNENRLNRSGQENLKTLAKIEQDLQLEEPQTYRNYFNKIMDLSQPRE